MPINDDIPVDDWVFHASVAYCDLLPQSRWHQAMNVVPDIQVHPAACSVEHAELVTYDGGPERLAGSFPLGRE
jgi:hypothetical protein